MPSPEEARHYPPEYFDVYQSPFSYRYGSPPMREVWGENHRWDIATQIWAAVAEAQHAVGLVTDEELADLQNAIGRLSHNRITEIEAETRHDIVAALIALEEIAPIGGRKAHQGMTSEDMSSNMDAIRIGEGLDIIEARLDTTLLAFAEGIEATADIPCMGWSHIQPAEPTTVGYRLARHGQDLLLDRALLKFMRTQIGGKGIKGAVGTSASFTELLKGTGLTARKMEEKAMAILGISPTLVTGQLYPRKFDALAMSGLASIGESAYNFGLNLRLLQSPQFGEWSEPRGKKQSGSTAMPWKKNPINAENMMSIGRYVMGIAAIANTMASDQILERGLDDSAQRRIWLPESFLGTDECLIRMEKVARGLVINQPAISRTLQFYETFSAVEKVLLAAVDAGASRPEMHEELRELSVAAFDTVQSGEPNPLIENVRDNKRVQQYLDPNTIAGLFEGIEHHVGDAPERTRELAANIREAVATN